LGMAEGVKKGFCRFQVGRVHPCCDDPKFSSSNTETRRTQRKTKDWIKPGAHPSGADNRISCY
jgi:hypothetical protein